MQQTLETILMDITTTLVYKIGMVCLLIPSDIAIQKNPANVSNLGILHDNKIYNPSGSMKILCGKTSMTEAQFQAKGADKGTTVHKTPKYDVIIDWARKLLED